MEPKSSFAFIPWCPGNISTCSKVKISFGTLVKTYGGVTGVSFSRDKSKLYIFSKSFHLPSLLSQRNNQDLICGFSFLGVQTAFKFQAEIVLLVWQLLKHIFTHVDSLSSGCVCDQMHHTHRHSLISMKQNTFPDFCSCVICL